MTGHNETNSPQGIRHSSPNYFRRMLAEEHDDAIRDQEVLRINRNAIETGDLDELASALQSREEFSNLWEHFYFQGGSLSVIPPKMMLNLASKLFSAELSE